MAVHRAALVGSPARQPLLSRLRRRGALAQLLPVAAARRPRTASPRWRSGSAGPWWKGSSCLRFCPRYPQHIVAVLVGRGHRSRNSQRSSGRSSSDAAAAEAGRCARAASASRPPRRTARSPASARPTRRRTTRSTTALARPGVRLVDLRAGAQARLSRWPRSSSRCSRSGSGAWIGPSRSSSRSTSAAGRARASSASCRCGRWRCRARPRSSTSSEVDGATLLVCRSARVLGNGTDRRHPRRGRGRLPALRARPEPRTAAPTSARFNAELLAQGGPTS